MDIVELKRSIEAGSIGDSPLIFKFQDNKFLSQQYVDAIADMRNLSKLYISSLSEIPSDDMLFNSQPEYLYIIDVEKFSENITNSDKNVIVICEKVADNLAIDYIDFPKVTGWQVEDYVKMRLPGLDSVQVKWLCDIAKYDIFRLDNECKKLEIFSKEEQSIIFDLINEDNGYCDMNTLTIFNFTNAVIKKDLKTIRLVLQDLKNIDIEGSGLITIFHKQFKNIINIQMNPRATAESTGMSSKQFNAVKYNCGNYSSDQLIKIYSFITSLDKRLKNGEFQFTNGNRENNAKFVEYITLNILNIGLAT